MISSETVNSVSKRIAGLSEHQTRVLAEQMSREQPLVMAYLLATSEREEFDEDESDLFFFIGIVVWQIMKHSPKGQDKITEQQLERAEKANTVFLEKMGSESLGDFAGITQALVEGYAEPEVLRFVTQALMEGEHGDPENPPMREESLGAAFLYLKIILDAFIGPTR